MELLELQPELGVELTPDMSYVDLRQRAEAACRSILLLEDYGLEVPEATSEEKEAIATATSAYAANPELTSKAVSNTNAAKMTPASLKNLRVYLDEFGQAVVQGAVELRHLVTNRLLQESDNPDPRIRIRALELLGKISDVGLFTDRTEVTITHQTTDDLKSKLREKLTRLTKPVYEVRGGIQMSDTIVDVDAELGLKPHEPAETPKTEEIWVPSSEITPESPGFDD